MRLLWKSTKRTNALGVLGLYAARLAEISPFFASNTQLASEPARRAFATRGFPYGVIWLCCLPS